MATTVRRLIEVAAKITENGADAVLETIPPTSLRTKDNIEKAHIVPVQAVPITQSRWTVSRIA